MESSIRFLISVLTLLFWVTSSYAQSSAKIFRYVLEGGKAEIRSYCANDTHCYPIRLELHESNKVIISSEITSDSLQSWIERLNTEGELLAYFRTQTVHLLGKTPNQINDAISILVSAPLGLRENSDRVQALLKGHTVNRSVFRELSRSIWPESGYVPPKNHPIEFTQIDKPIRVLGRGITKSNGDETLYLSCLNSSLLTNECEQYQFIIEKPSKAERAAVGAPFKAHANDPFKNILTDRIEQILNGVDFRAFYASLDPLSGWNQVKGPYTYSAEDALPNAFRYEWRMLTSRNVSDWQFRPIQVSDASFYEIISLLDFDDRILGKPCVGRPISIRQSDHTNGNRDKDFEALYVSLNIDFMRDSFADRLHFSQMEFFFRYFFGGRTCSKNASDDARFRYRLEAKKNSVCIRWSAFDGRSEHDLTSSCKSKWSFTELVSEFDQATEKAQKFFIRADKRNSRERSREEYRF